MSNEEIPSWSKQDVIDALSKEKYGHSFAKQVAHHLKSLNKKLMYTHRDFCGLGLLYDNNKQQFKFCYVYDGYEDNYASNNNENGIISFNKEDEFIEFLENQCDYSLSGADSKSVFYEKDIWTRNNQRIDKKRLERMIGGNADECF
ncbi:hypothetical protein ABK040_002038 [Willaertia magna]